MKNIIISSNGSPACLGHEIHMTRVVIIDMLLQNVINESDIVVVRNDDKKFLYETLFENVINYNEFLELENNSNHYNIIDLSVLNIDPMFVNTRINIPNFTISEKYYTDKFKSYLLKFKYIEDINELKDFVVYHHRYNSDYGRIHLIYKKIMEIYGGQINIVIFNNNIDTLKKEFLHDNIIFIDNLQLYATYLNHHNCKLFISEWSGGGQLSQYCCKSTIMYYFDAYQGEIAQFYIKNTDYCIENAISNNYDSSWDFKNPSDCNIFMFDNINNLLDFLPTHVTI
jgi:hypothetical protein